MKQDDMQLGMRVRFRRPLGRKYVPRNNLKPPRKEWQPDQFWKPDRWKEGILIGVRTLTDGDYDFGGHEEQASLYNTTHFRAALVVESLSTNPVRVRFEDVEPMLASAPNDHEVLKQISEGWLG